MLGAVIYRKNENILIDIDEDDKEIARFDVDGSKIDDILEYDSVCFRYDDYSPYLAYAISNSSSLFEQVEQAKTDSLNPELIGSIILPSGNRIILMDNLIYDWSFNFIVE